MAEKTAYIKAIAGFIFIGRKPVEAGEELTVPETFARELVGSGKAQRMPPPVAVEAPKDPPDSKLKLKP